MQIELREGLPFVTAWLTYRGEQIRLDNVLLDTGSVGCVFATHKLEAIDLLPDPNDRIEQIRGVGGTEFVYIKKIDSLDVEDLKVKNFEIEVGAVNYGFRLDGIIGMDFLIETGASIDLSKFTINKSGSK